MVKLAINYIDDNGVRQIFSDIKSNLDSVNNTAVSAYDRANEAYSIASEGSITPNTQVFNIDGSKTFTINNGSFLIFVNSAVSYSDFRVISGRLYYYSYRNNDSTSTILEAGSDYVDLSVFKGRYLARITLDAKGIYMSDGTHSGYINVANCI